MDKADDCTCWRLPTDDGRVLPLAYVCMHDEVRVQTSSGEAVQGFSVGADWWSTPDGPEIYMEIERYGREPVVLTKADLSTVSPIGGFTDRSRFEEAIAHLIDVADADGGSDSISLIVSEHAIVEVTVSRHTTSCSPPARPRWRWSAHGVAGQQDGPA